MNKLWKLCISHSVHKMGNLKSASAFSLTIFFFFFFFFFFFNLIVYPHLGVPDTNDLRVFETFGLYLDWFPTLIKLHFRYAYYVW